MKHILSEPRSVGDGDWEATCHRCERIVSWSSTMPATDDEVAAALLHGADVLSNANESGPADHEYRMWPSEE